MAVDSSRIIVSETSGSVQAAIARGRTALAARDPANAVRWLDRAHRLIPGDTAVKLLLGSALFGIDAGRATELLVDVVGRHPRAWAARQLLLNLHMRAGRMEAAADQLAPLLSRSAMPPGAPFQKVASQVAASTGCPGWVGLAPDGTLVLSAPGKLSLDGNAIPVPLQYQKESLLAVRLPVGWQNGAHLQVTSSGRHFIGSPLDIQAHVLVEGFVEQTPTGELSGWAWMPAAPDIAPVLRVVHADGNATLCEISASDEDVVPRISDGISRPRGFRVRTDQLPPLPATVHILTATGQNVFGSPIPLGGERAAARYAAARLAQATPATEAPARPRRGSPPDLWRPLPAGSLPPLNPTGSFAPATQPPRRAPIDVVIPVFRGAADFLACLETLRGTPGAQMRLVIVDDGSTDRALRDAIAASGAIVLRHARNLGFPAAANTGLRHAARAAGGPRDVVLLNPDTLLPRQWLKRLADAAYAAADIGSVTPMSTDGSIVCYPTPGEPGPTFDKAALDRTDRLFARANGAALVDLPTAVGFCMFIRHDCLAETGLFREDCFAQGYGEENDWCLRARHLGWRHVAHTGLLVAHAGGRSFGPVRADLLARNLSTLNRLHPGYDAAIQAFLAADPLAPARRAVDRLRWAAAAASAGSVVLVSHDQGGGVERHVRARADQLRQKGLRPILLTPLASEHGEMLCGLSDDSKDTYPNLRFDTAASIKELAEFLRPDQPQWLELHHQLGHPAHILDLAKLLQIPFDMYVHDFAAVCPRITFLGPSRVYCGEPAETADCDACIADAGSRLQEDIGAAALRARSAAHMSAARRIIAPTPDAARRIGRYVAARNIVVRPWEDDSRLSRSVARPQPPPEDRAVRICLAGGIGEEKGYAILLACARDAARRDLALQFTLVGHSMDDARLIDTGRVFVTGAYQEAEAVALIRAQQPDIGFLPSVWPETWCYTLSALWLAGLWPVAFQLGAQGERIGRTGRGTLLPLGLPPSRINDAMLRLAHGTDMMALERRRSA